MKIYKVASGILIHSKTLFWLVENEDWDSFINDDQLFAKATDITVNMPAINNGPDLILNELLPPIQNQEIWASGVTYFNSKLARQEESKEAGGGDFYARVYVAARPELFFKATAYRTVGSGGKVKIRKDSTWDVPEPELTLVLTSSGKIVGYTIGNDMSSRSIEGENPLYLPQAKTYDGCAAIGPCIYVSDKPLDPTTEVHLNIKRDQRSIFNERITISQMKRTQTELAAWLFKETSFPFGCFLMTGTGIVPPREFTLQSGDEIHISIAPIGTLINTVEA